MNKKSLKSKMETENHSNGKKQNRKNVWKFGILLLAIILSVTGCRKEKEDNPTNVSADEKTAQALATIRLTADSILLSDDPLGGFEAIAEEYRKIAEVDSIENDMDGLFIKFANGRMVGWYIPPEITPPTIDDTLLQNLKSIINTKQTSGSSAQKSVCLLDQVDGRANDQAERERCLSYLEAIFSENNWSVDKKIGNQITLDFVSKHLDDYDAIYYIAHGVFALGKSWIATGESGTVSPNRNQIELFIAERVFFRVIRKYAFSHEFIRHHYNPDDFKGDIIYMVACQSMGSRNIPGRTNFDMAKAFTDYGGASVYIGWDESNHTGETTGRYLYDLLWKGYTLGEAYQWLDINKHELIENAIGVSILGFWFPLEPKIYANLKYYPDTADTVWLIKPSITMTIPATVSTVNFSLTSVGEVTVDWGDGKEFIYPNGGDIQCSHTYAVNSSYTIRIKGTITSLNCINSQLSSLDVSDNPALTRLLCSTNQLTELDVSKNRELTYLACINNQLTTLDVSQNPKLTELYCGKNKLTALDVSQNIKLSLLECRNNLLEAVALNALFGTLHTNETGVQKRIIIDNNPGAGACQRSVALEKKWSFAL
jgi:Leucine-rich repeat (LRR) protein